MVAVAVAAGLLAGCGGGGGEEGSARLVIDGKPPASPYRGPLSVAHRQLDQDTPEGLRAASGAAGRALECDGEIYSGGPSGGWSERDGGGTPEEGLRAYFDMGQPDVPDYGYRVEHEADGRVLYSFDVAGRTKVAVVVAKDRPDSPGWGPETSAWCDPAELPAEFTDDQPYEVWTDRDGKRVPLNEVSSSAGAEHCDWQRAHFLSVGRDAEGKLYARDPHRVLPTGMLTAPYRAEVTMPGDARNTGYRLGDRELWLAADRSTAYVRTSGGVEAWPAVREGMGCA